MTCSCAGLSHRCVPVLVLAALSAVTLSLAGCSPPPLRGKGGACHSLTDCKPGLVCDEGRCTADLSDLARNSDEPPFLMLVDAGAAPADAGAADAAAVDTMDATVQDAEAPPDTQDADAAPAGDGG